MNDSEKNRPHHEIAFLVHDLEPAMASLQTIITLLQSGRYDAENRLHQKLVAGCGHALDFSLAIIRDILALGKMRDGETALHPGEIIWNDELPGMLATAVILGRDKDVELLFEVGDRHLISRSDPHLVQRVLGNLVINSIKYSGSDSRVWVRARSGRENGVVVEIEDEGPGLAPEQLSRIFDDYYQADSAASGGYRGVGLGLPFCREAIARLGGRIEVKNRLPTGLLFTICLPEL